jgi:hypothetical protein
MNKYKLFPENGKAITYAKGIELLKKKGFIRPLTCGEVIKAKVEDYECGNKDLIKYRINTCTGAFYKGGGDLVKLVRIDESLLNLDSDFIEAYIKQDYNLFEGFEIDRKKAKYNQFLTKDEIINHPTWNWLVQDKYLLKKYVEIVFAERNNPEKSMGIWLRKSKTFTTSRAVFIDDILNDSVVYCINYLFDNVRFLVNDEFGGN